MAINNVDLLAGYLTAAGLTAQANEMVFIRGHIYLSLVMTNGVAGAGNGAMVAVWVDNRGQASVQASLNVYDQQWLAWDSVYLTEPQMQGGVTPFGAVRRYDLRAKRKVPGITDTVWMQIANLFNGTVTSYSITVSLLMMSR